MVVDRCPEVLEIAPRAAYGTPPAHILSAGFAGHLGELSVPPELVEPLQTRVKLGAPGLQRTAVVVVDRQHVGDGYVFDIALAAVRPVLVGDVCGELDLRFCNFARKASCGDMFVAVENDPDCLADTLSRF